MSSCDSHFTLSNLTSSSYGNENFIIDECISNWAKFGLFSLWFILWFIAFLWSLYVLYVEVRKTGFKWDLRKKIYVFTIISTFFELIAIILYITGLQTPIRYFIFAVPLQSVRMVVSWSISAWFQTSMSITRNTNERLQKMFKISIIVMDVITAVLTISCCIVGPMVAFSNGDANQVNWFYSIRTSVTSFIGTCICLLIHFVGGELVRVCQRDEVIKGKDTEEDRIERLLGRLKTLIKTANQCLPGQLVLIFFPFWMWANLYGVFWFQFTFNEFNLLLSVVIMAWLFKEEGKNFGVSSGSSHSHPSESARKASSSHDAIARASYTVQLEHDVHHSPIGQRTSVLEQYQMEIIV